MHTDKYIKANTSYKNCYIDLYLMQRNVKANAILVGSIQLTFMQLNR